MLPTTDYVTHMHAHRHTHRLSQAMRSRRTQTHYHVRAAVQADPHSALPMPEPSQGKVQGEGGGLWRPWGLLQHEDLVSWVGVPGELRNCLLARTLSPALRLLTTSQQPGSRTEPTTTLLLQASDLGLIWSKAGVSCLARMTLICL